MNSQVKELLACPSAILFGSRALGVADADSDYDIAMLSSDLPDKYINIGTTHIRNYFRVYPNHGSRMLRLIGIDILLLDDISDLLIVNKAAQLIAQVPALFLQNRAKRIIMYEQALEYYGFATSTQVPFDGNIPWHEER